MTKEQYDVVIVGGGPAGSNAARVAKEHNTSLDVLLCERGQFPTSNCAGGLGLPFYKHMGYRPPEEVVKSPIRKVTMASPNEELTIGVNDVDLDSIDWTYNNCDELGWVVDRAAWDQHQLKLAEDAGVDVRCKHTVKSVNQGNTSVEVEVHDRESNEMLSVEAAYVGLACGANWDLAVQAGFDEDELVPSKDHLHMGLQYHMKDPDYFEDYGWDQIYLLFDRDYAPEGYTWSFPEGKEYTRWGNGIPMSSDSSPSECLNRFLEDHGKAEYVDTARQKTNAIIPTANPLDTCISGRVGLIGDNGRHCDPLHGGGMMFGARAGKAFGKSVAEDNIAWYDDQWRSDFLQTLQHRFVIRDLIYSMSNDEYDRFIGSMQGFELTGVNPDKEIPRLLWHCLKKDRGIFTKSAVEATKSAVKQRFAF